MNQLINRKVDVFGYCIDTTLRRDNPLYWSIGAVFGSYKVLSYLYGKKRLSEKRRRKREERDQALQKLEDSLRSYELTNEDIEAIVSLELTVLQEKLRSGQLTPTQVLHAYQAKALEVHKKTNCLVEPITEAEEWAHELEESGDRDGALFGVPVSIKDNYGLKGYDSTIGCSDWIDKPFADDAVIVKALKAAGAIPFVKTNVPQTMLSYETSNPIYGGTRNPQDVTRGAGGSSGGEGALIAGGGSILGFGSDIGGSIRIPASMCGICGFKPTAGRISSKGTHPIFKGQTNLQSCYGPLARDVDSLIVATRTLCNPDAWKFDQTIPPVPFNEQVLKSPSRKLRIGVLLSDPYLPAVPAMQRAVQQAERTLQQLGHEVVPFFIPDLGEKAARLFTISLFADGGQALKQILENDTTDTSTFSLLGFLYTPVWLKKVIALLLYPFMKKLSLVLKWSFPMKGVGKWWDLCAETSAVRNSVIQEWKDKNLDALISPGFTCLPLPFGQAAHAPGATFYTMLYNILNFPAGTLPITTVTADDVNKMADYPTPDILQKTIKKGMVGSEGLTVNVQVVTLPWQEELCLSIMKELEEATQFKRLT